MDTKIIKIALYKNYLKAYTTDKKILKIKTEGNYPLTTSRN